MELDFTLTFIKSSQSYYVMEGGPLERTWTENNWEKWILTQPKVNHTFYMTWAAQARLSEGHPIKRILA